MGKPDFTVDQQKAINAKGTVLISAAAGSGKTAVLTERVANLLCDSHNPIDADRLLIVTFTNAAALELRTRINEALSERSKNDPSNRLLKKQKLLLGKAKICTIDAFCIDLVRRYFGVLGISPNFSIAGTATEKSISSACIEDVLKNRYKNPDEGFDLLCEIYNAEQGDTALKSDVAYIYEKSLCMAMPDKWIHLAEKNYSADDLNSCVYTENAFKTVILYCRKAKGTLSLLSEKANSSPYEKNCAAGVSDAIGMLDSAITSAKRSEWDEVYGILNSFKLNIARMTKSLDPETYTVITKLKDKIKKSVEKAQKAVFLNGHEVTERLHACLPAVKAFADMVTEYGEKYFAELEKRGVYTFAMIEQLTLKLLCREENGKLVPTEIAEEIANSYDEVLVDEYQDTSMIQDALFRVISKDQKNLFMVGDVKQSIYGFRNASPEQFLEYNNTFPDYTEGAPKSKITLARNFRSRIGVCDTVNAFCSVCFGTDTCGMEYNDGDRLIAGADFAEHNVPDTDVLITDCGDCNADPKKEDGTAVANYIEKIMSEGITVGHKGREKPLEYGDICILLRSPTTDAKYYTDALAVKGIPYCYNSDAFFDSPEILTVLSVLNVINNPLRDIDLIAAMTSPAFGIPYSVVASAKACKKNSSLYLCMTEAAEKSQKIKHFFNTVSNLRTASVTLTPDRLIAKLYEKTSLPEIVSAFPNGSIRRDNLLKLQMSAAGYDAGKGGLRQFLGDVERLTDDPEAVKTVPEGVNAVKLMSFHGSKGLQFPVCILPNLQKGFNKEDRKNKVINDDRLGFAIRIGETDNIGRNAVISALNQRMIAEEIRLLYVAMTRAEEKLVLSMSLKNAKEEVKAVAEALRSFSEEGVQAAEITEASARAKWILMTLLTQKDGGRIAESFGAPPLCADGKARFTLSVLKPAADDGGVRDAELKDDVCKHENDSVDQCIADEIKRRFDYVYPHEADTKVPSKLAVTELIRGERSNRSFMSRPAFMMEGGMTPAEKGTATHKFMQLANFNNAKLNTAAEVERLNEWEYLTDEEANAIDTEAVSAFFKTDLFKRVEKSDKCLREYKFMIEHPYDGVTTIVQGIADCIFLENGEYVILDFKTDRVKNADELRDEYREQLEIYKEAIEKIFEKRVKECILYSIPLGQYTVI